MVEKERKAEKGQWKASNLCYLSNLGREKIEGSQGAMGNSAGNSAGNKNI